MNETISAQELHCLAMEVVGEDLKKQGFEFLAVNSKLKKNPQFVALKNKELHFVIVRAVEYPTEPQVYDPIYMQTMKAHAQKFDAKAYYAGVGLGHGNGYEQPIVKNEPYSIVYNGLQEIT
tara:strand:- start:554 stop:916 length:363 start_codon:yes stop_codon:yes gene_type:complete